MNRFFIPFNALYFIFTVPDKYRKGIESKCLKFIWDGKPDKVKRNTDR
jgi:hypothetical protein